jgi:HD superfamily phosphohydrolase
MKLIYDNYHGNIEISLLESQLLQNPLLNRLHQILQNSTAYLVYPCCKTSRFEHSIGTMDYASKLMHNGLSNSTVAKKYINEKACVIRPLLVSKEEDFFKLVLQRQGMLDVEKGVILKKYNDSFNNILDSPMFLRELVDFIGCDFISRNFWFPIEKDEVGIDKPFSTFDAIFTLLLHESLRIQALLHDIGHLPFSHLFEFAIESINHVIDGQEKYKKFSDKIKSVVDEKDKLHEKIGKEITKFILTNLAEDYREEPHKALVVIFIEEILNEIRKGKKGHLFSLYQIISNTIDADRLDFIQRDGANSGVSVSAGNIDRIIKFYNLCELPDHFAKSTDNFSFLPSIQSISDIEELLRGRFAIYKYMVNHHAVKRTDHILQKIIEHKIISELENYSNSENNSEEYFDHTNISDSIDIALKIFNIDSKGNNFKTIIYQFFQLTDFWLLSKINTDFNKSIRSGGKDKYDKFLSQIYENKRHFKSLWKRGHEYSSFLELLGEMFFDEKDKYLEVHNPFEPRIKAEYNNYEDILDVVSCLEQIEKCQDDQSDKCQASKWLQSSYICDICQSKKCRKILRIKLARLVIDFLKICSNNNNDWCESIEKKITNVNIRFLLSQTKLKDGFEKDKLLLVDNKNKGSIDEFDNHSILRKALQNDIENSIQFFVYIWKEGEIDIEDSNKIIASEIRSQFKTEFTKCKELQNIII